MSFPVLLLSPLLAVADTSSMTPMHMFLPPAAGQWNLSGTGRSYPGDGIFDYMDGAGEIYRAYHFRDLLVAQYVSPGREEILVEIFDMGSARNAFGVFSHVRGERPALEIGQGGDYEAGLLCFWKERYFVCIKTEIESPKTSAAVRTIGEDIARAIPQHGKLPALLGYLPQGGYVQESLRYFFRSEILERHFYVADENLLHLDGQTEGVLVRMQSDGGHLLLVGYAGKAEADSAYDHFRRRYMPDAGVDGVVRTENGLWTACTRKGTFVAVVFDSPTREAADSRISDLFRRLP